MIPKTLWVCSNYFGDVPMTRGQASEVHNFNYWGKMFPEMEIACGNRWASSTEEGITLAEAAEYDVVFFIMAVELLPVLKPLFEFENRPKIVLFEDAFGMFADYSDEVRPQILEIVRNCEMFTLCSESMDGYYSALLPNIPIKFMGLPMPDSIRDFRVDTTQIVPNRCTVAYPYYDKNQDRIIANGIRAAAKAGYTPFIQIQKDEAEFRKMLDSYSLGDVNFYHGEKTDDGYAMMPQRDWHEAVRYSECAVSLTSERTQPGRFTLEMLALGVPVVSTFRHDSWRRFLDYGNIQELLSPENLTEVAMHLELFRDEKFRKKYLEVADGFWNDQLREVVVKKRLISLLEKVMS